MIALLLLGCGADECNVVTAEVSDDAPLGDLAYTAGDVAAAATGAFDLTVDAPEHGWVGATVSLARAEASAVFHDATFVERVDRDDVDPFAPVDMMIEPACVDHVEVPVTMAFAAEDLGVDVTADLLAAPTANAVGTVTGAALSGRIPADTPGLPAARAEGFEVMVNGGLVDGDLRWLELQWSDGFGASPLATFPVTPGSLE